MRGYNFIFWVQKNQHNIHRKGIVVFVLFMFMALNGQGQWCGVGPDDSKTYLQTLNDYSGRTTTITTASQSDNFEFTEDNWMLLIPSGIQFTGGINGGSHSNTVICIVGTFNPPWVNNYSGIIRNYNKTSTITIDRVYPQIENYGGAINFTSNQCGNILNFNGGTISCTGNVNIGNGYAVYNEGVFNVASALQGDGCIQNEAWISVNSYFGNNDILNNGKIEVKSTQMSFNGGTIVNNCAFFSGASGTNFQNNTNIENNGLIYLPVGKFENKAGKTLTNGETGVIRARNFDNRGNFYGSGWVYVTNTSENYGTFGQGSDNIHFYDASPGGNPCNFDTQNGSIGPNVAFTPFPEPAYSPDLSEYQCGDIIMAGSINPGVIAENQILCLGTTPEPFTSIEDASVPNNGAIITYQWQSSTDNEIFYNIPGATLTTYSPSRPAVETFYRRRAKSSYPGADSVKNAINSSNVLTITPVDQEPASITTHPSNGSVCHEQDIQFSAAAQYYDSYQWQESTDNGNSWNNLSETPPYSGTTSGALTITEVPAGMDGYLYRLVAINNFCGNAYSNAATLTVVANDSPVITSQPANQFVCPGTTSALFIVTTEDACDYQWQRSTNGGGNWFNLVDGTEDYSGVETNTLTVNNNGVTNLHQFRCILSAVCDETTSDAATLYRVVPEVVVTPITIIKCPDTDPALDFNSLNHEYDMGMSAISFTIEKETEGPFPWSFNYEITATPDLLAGEQPQNITGTFNYNAETTSVELTFYLENQTEETVEATFSITNVTVAGCTETPNSNHSTTVYVRRMPVSGIFATE